MNTSLPRSSALCAPGLAQRLATYWAPSQVFDFWASRLNPAWSWDRPLARVLERRRESANAVTLLLQPNRHWLGFRPGQHVNVGAQIEGTWVTRSYSLTGPPRADGRIAITVKAVEGGRLSGHLCRDARVGDVLALGQAFGDMVLPDLMDAPWLFLAAGSGITPLIAMTRELAARGMPVPLTLLYWARHRDELCFVDELRALASRHAGFQVQFLLTQDAAISVDEGEGRIGEALLSMQVPTLPARHVFACGPGGFVESARAMTAAHARSFHAEAFSPPPRTVEHHGTAQITLANSGRTLTVPRGESLLTALEAAGLKPASGCRMGICNTCACNKPSGSTRNLLTGDVQHDVDSALRLCIHSADSDLVLEL